MTAEEQKLCSDLIDMVNKQKKLIKVLQGAVKEAVRILSVSPPSVFDEYNEGMYWAVVNSKEEPEKWANYLLKTSMNSLGIDSSEIETKDIN